MRLNTLTCGRCGKERYGQPFTTLFWEARDEGWTVVVHGSELQYVLCPDHSLGDVPADNEEVPYIEGLTWKVNCQACDFEANALNEDAIKKVFEDHICSEWMPTRVPSYSSPEQQAERQAQHKRWREEYQEEMRRKVEARNKEVALMEDGATYRRIKRRLLFWK